MLSTSTIFSLHSFNFFSFFVLTPFFFFFLFKLNFFFSIFPFSCFSTCLSSYLSLFLTTLHSCHCTPAGKISLITFCAATSTSRYRKHTTTHPAACMSTERWDVCVCVRVCACVCDVCVMCVCVLCYAM